MHIHAMHHTDTTLEGSECKDVHKGLPKIGGVSDSEALWATPRIGPNESFVIRTDASNKVIGAILLQEQLDGYLRPCSYYVKILDKS